MRRVLLMVLCIALPVLTLGPALAGASTSSSRALGPSGAHAPHHCKKGKKGHKHRCKRKRHKTPTPRPAAPAADTPTPTPTSTPTPTPTSTSTPTPISSEASMQIRSYLATGYQAAFFVCGLPTGTAALLDPNPATSTPDPTSPVGAAAHVRLLVIASSAVPPASYSLAIYAYFKDRAGNSVDAPAGGGAIDPPALTLTIDHSRNATLTPLSTNPGVGLQSCSPIPPGFAPTPTPTPPANAVAVYASVSDPHPVAGELETVYATIQVHGQPVPSVVVHTHWYFPDALRSCDAVTGPDGVGSCSMIIERTVPNQTVVIQLTFQFNGQEFIAYTSFMT